MIQTWQPNGLIVVASQERFTTGEIKYRAEILVSDTLTSCASQDRKNDRSHTFHVISRPRPFKYHPKNGKNTKHYGVK